jgi:uncharacterized protein YjiS (DUF1127 family)
MYALVPILRRGSVDGIELSKGEYDAISRARMSVQAAVGVEQNFALLVDNYVEYERELLELASQLVVRPEASLKWREVQSQILRANRRLANLLSSARLYLDQLRSEIASLVPPAEGTTAQEEVKRYTKTAYDDRFGYRVMEALRNVVQHAGLGVRSISYPHDSPGENQRRRELRHRAVPNLSVHQLRDIGLKAAVLSDWPTEALTAYQSPRWFGTTWRGSARCTRRCGPLQKRTLPPGWSCSRVG